jgi:hypothetical protein
LVWASGEAWVERSLTKEYLMPSFFTGILRLYQFDLPQHDFGIQYVVLRFAGAFLSKTLLP